MASLYEQGWRQGTIIEATLPLDEVILDETAGRADRRQGEHGLWVVASQDCDLDHSDASERAACIELRPVFVHDPPADWGIRSAKHLITEDEYIVSTSARPMVAPAVLTALVEQGTDRRSIDEVRRPAFAKWLGLRYDRPAVPETLFPLARRISDAVSQRRRRPVAHRVRDVLMQFDDTTEPPGYSLVAVLDDPEDEDAVRVWLAEIARDVPAALGVAHRIEAAPATAVSLQLIESSFGADVTKITWRPGSPEPEGAA